MTSLLLHKTAGLELAAQTRVIKADEFSTVGDAIAVMNRLEQIRGEAEAGAQQARDEGHQRGFEQGRSEGYSAGWAQSLEDFARRIAALEQSLEAQRARRDAQIAELAMAVVMRVARDVGSPQMMAGVVARALDDLRRDAPVRIKVNPANYEIIQARLGPRTREISLVIDDTMGAFDCEFETEGGQLDVGLASQLEAIGEALRGRRLDLGLAA